MKIRKSANVSTRKNFSDNSRSFTCESESSQLATENIYITQNLWERKAQNSPLAALNFHVITFHDRFVFINNVLIVFGASSKRASK